MIQIDVHLDLEGLQLLAELGAKAPTATAKALTFTAQDSQTLLKAQAGGIFHLRSNWVPGGIRIKPATGGNLNAEVGSIDKYMERHVVGAGLPKPAEQPLSIHGRNGTRTPRIASGGLLVKTYGSTAQVPKHQTVLSRLRRMGGNKRKPFQIATGGRVLIVSRAGKGSLPLKVHAMLIPSATVPEKWDMLGSVSGMVQARFGHHFEGALLKAAG